MPAEVLIAAIVTLVGAIIGGLLAVRAGVVQHRLRREGNLYCIVSHFRWENDLDEEEQDAYRGYTLYVKVFNEQEVGIGVRDVNVTFFEGCEEVATDRPRDTVEGYHADYLNFRPREWLVRQLRAGDIELKSEDGPPREEDVEAWRMRMQKVMTCDWAQIKVRLPDCEPTVIYAGPVPMPAGKERATTIGGTHRRSWPFGG